MLSGLGAEACLRRFHPIDATIYRLHPRYLHALIPGARKLSVHGPESGGGKLLVRVNGAGFLGPELARVRRGRRLLVYGDSFVAAEFSPARESFVGRLGARLATALGEPVEAVNGGVVGYGPDQAALRLEDELASLTPDLVVVAVFAGNDFGDLMRNRLFRLDARGELAARRPKIAPSLQREFARAERLSRGSMLLRGIRHLLTRQGAREGRASRRASLLPEGGFPLLLEKRRREYEESIERADDEVLHLLGDPYDADVSLAPGSASARYKVALMEQVLLRVAAAARARSTPVSFVFIPSAFDVCDGWEHPDAPAFPEYRRDALTRALAGLAQRNGLAYLDLYPHFRSAGADALYFRADEHWNAAGQDLAAVLTTPLLVSAVRGGS